MELDVDFLDEEDVADQKKIRFVYEYMGLQDLQVVLAELASIASQLDEGFDTDLVEEDPT